MYAKIIFSHNIFCDFLKFPQQSEYKNLFYKHLNHIKISLIINYVINYRLQSAKSWKKHKRLP